MPLTLGECETFAATMELARTYMARVDARRVRSSGDGAFAAFTDVAAYDDDLLVGLCRSLSGSPVPSVTHYDDAVAVAYATHESPAAVRERLTGRVRALAALTDDEESACYSSVCK